MKFKKRHVVVEFNPIHTGLLGGSKTGGGVTKYHTPLTIDIPTHTT